MRSLRTIPALTVALLALAGVAAAVAVGVNADHSTTLDDKSLSGSHALSADDGGLSASLHADAGAASVTYTAGLTLPALPEAPTAPDVPEVPEVGMPDVPQVNAPEVPEAPSVTGGADAKGSAGATTDHASASGNGAVGVHHG